MGALLPDIKPQLLFSRVSEHCRMAKVILYTWQVALTCLQVILKCITTETIDDDWHSGGCGRTIGRSIAPITQVQGLPGASEGWCWWT